MRVIFHNGAVHERAGVALVAVADDVFRRGFLALHLAPLLAGGESSAPAPAQVGLADLVDDIVRAHVEKRLFKCGIAAHAQILADGIGIDLAAVLQHKALLLLIERDFVLFGINLAVLFVGQPLHKFSGNNGFVDDFLTVGNLHLGVKVSFRVNAHKGADLAETGAAALGDAHAVIVRVLCKLHLAGDAAFAQQLHKARINIQRAAGYTACAGAYEDLAGLFLCGVAARGAQIDQVLSILEHVRASPSAFSAVRTPYPASSRGIPYRSRSRQGQGRTHPSRPRSAR